MEARDSGSRIRPLPIDDIDGDAPQHLPIEPRRRWTPLIVIVAGALAFGFIARGLGLSDSTDVGSATTEAPAALAEEASPPTTTTSPPPPPPQLRQLLSIATDGFSLVAATPTNARVGHWSPAATAPSFNANISQPRSAAYNSDGSRVAIHTWVTDGSFGLDSAEGGRPVYLRDDITSGVWHPTDPDLFAWTQPDADSASDQTTLRVADLSGETSFGLQPLIEFSVPYSNHTLHAWGDWGFATNSGNAVFGFDPDGIQTRSGNGSFFDAALDGTLLLATADEEGLVPYLLQPDGTEMPLPNLDIGASDFELTTDGSWVLAITFQEDGHTSILARTVHSRSTRLTSIDQTARVISTAWDDRFLVLQEVHTNDLLFKDWNSGAEYRVPTGVQVAAVHLTASSN